MSDTIIERKGEYILAIQDESKLTSQQLRFLKFTHLIDLEFSKGTRKVNFPYINSFLQFVAKMGGRIMIDHKTLVVLNGCVDIDY